MNELALFAGAGGGILGGKLLGWRTICAVENDPYARRVLLARQRDGILSRFPIWDDIKTFDGRCWEGNVDVISGGFPCQDISSAGSKKGISGTRSGLWAEMAHVISEARPKFVFVENSPALVIRGLDIVLGDLAKMGYGTWWGVLGAADAQFPHIRKRIWIVAYSQNQCRLFLPRTAKKKQYMGDRRHFKQQINRFVERLEREGKQCCTKGESNIPSYLWRMDDGMAYGVDRLERIGNGQVPAVAAMAWNILSAGIE